MSQVGTRQESSFSGFLVTLPPHWRECRLMHVAQTWTSNVDKLSRPDETAVRLCNYTDVYKNASIVGDMAFMAATATGDQIERFRLRRGDTVVTKDSETADDIGVTAFVEYESPDLVCGYHLAIARPDPDVADPRFLYWALSSQPSRGQWRVLATGITRVGLRSGDLARLTVPVPPLPEQRAIADYLDRETAKIDQLIDKQQQLIAVIRERRAGLLTKLVTKGVEGDDLVDSGIRWLGSVPRHWRTGNIRRFAVMKTGHTPSRNVAEYWDPAEIPWFTLADVWQLRDGRATRLGETKASISRRGLAGSAAELLPSGTVVLSRTASVGFSGIMPRPMATSQDFWNWVCGPELLPDYLVQVFRAMTQEFGSMTIGSTHKTIYQAVAAGMHIPVPPVAEQVRIVEQLSEELDSMDSIIDKAQALIRLSRERRAALITAAVTGQIDVRDMAA